MPRPGYVRKVPAVDMMTDEQVLSLHGATLDVLRETGIRFEDEWALDFLDRNGCRVDRDLKRVRFPGELVEESIRKTPKRFTLRAPNPENDLDIGGDRLYFTHSSGSQTIDIETYEPKPATRQEYVDCIRVLDALPHLDHLGCYPYFGFDEMPALMAIPSGVAMHMRYSDKHQMTACSNDAELFTMQLAQAAGHEIVGTIGSSPPLTWSAGAIASARRMAASEFALATVDGSMMGGSGPATAPGSVIVSSAEHLAMLTIVQLLHPGHRMIIGHFSCPLNMRTGSPAFGQIGSSISNSLFNQLWRHYGIPISNGSPGYGNAKTMDYQSGWEKGIGGLASALSGVNSLLLHLGVSSELTAHPVQAILDDDIAGMVGRFVSGEEISAATMAVDVIDQVGPIPGHYLGTRHTRQWWGKEQFMPQTADATTYPEWIDLGKRNALDIAKDRMRTILAQPEKRLLTPGQESDIERILNEARDYYRDRS